MFHLLVYEASGTSQDVIALLGLRVGGTSKYCTSEHEWQFTCHELLSVFLGARALQGQAYGFRGYEINLTMDDQQSCHVTECTSLCYGVLFYNVLFVHK